MIKQKKDIIEFINSCNKCFVAYIQDVGFPRVLNIKFKSLQHDILVIGIESKVAKEIKILSQSRIAITMWDKITGYQLKGTKISKEKEDIACGYKDMLNDDGIDTSNIVFKTYQVEQIYNVSPGKLAGSKVDV